MAKVKVKNRVAAFYSRSRVFIEVPFHSQNNELFRYDGQDHEQPLGYIHWIELLDKTGLPSELYRPVKAPYKPGDLIKVPKAKDTWKVLSVELAQTLGPSGQGEIWAWRCDCRLVSGGKDVEDE